MPISKLISNPLDSDTATIYNLSVVCLTTELVNLMAIEIGIGFVWYKLLIPVMYHNNFESCLNRDLIVNLLKISI